MNQKGFTLFEVLIYIGLFSIIMFGALVGSFQVIEGTNDTRTRVVLEQEAHFIFRKIDWAMNGGVTFIGPIANGFRVRKSGDNIDFILDGNALTVDLDNGMGPELLTSSSVEVSNLNVAIIPANGTVPEALDVSFSLNGRDFASTIRYVR